MRHCSHSPPVSPFSDACNSCAASRTDIKSRLPSTDKCQCAHPQWAPRLTDRTGDSSSRRSSSALSPCQVRHLVRTGVLCDFKWSYDYETCFTRVGDCSLRVRQPTIISATLRGSSRRSKPACPEGRRCMRGAEMGGNFWTDGLYTVRVRERDGIRCLRSRPATAKRLGRPHTPRPQWHWLGSEFPRSRGQCVWRNRPVRLKDRRRRARD